MRKNVNLSDLEDVTKQKSFKNCELHDIAYSNKN